jgi:hypothetical protein
VVLFPGRQQQKGIGSMKEPLQANWQHTTQDKLNFKI